MNEFDMGDRETVLERIRAQAIAEDIRITQHAQQEMAEEDFVKADAWAWRFGFQDPTAFPEFIELRKSATLPKEVVKSVGGGSWLHPQYSTA